MDVSHCSTVLYILYLEGTWSLAFCLKFESYFWQKWYGVDIKGLVDALWSSSIALDTLKDGYETLQKQ